LKRFLVGSIPLSLFITPTVFAGGLKNNNVFLSRLKNRPSF